jgi:hypothetical protein
VFCSATVWAGVVASQRPITCPNRQLQPEKTTHLTKILHQNLYFVNKNSKKTLKNLFLLVTQR